MTDTEAGGEECCYEVGFVLGGARQVGARAPEDVVLVDRRAAPERDGSIGG